MLPVAILAGGLASRLRPITETIPKALVDIAGEPFIFHQLRYLQQQGIQQVVLCVGYLGERIEEAVKDGREFDLNVQYSYDGPQLLGTGGALRQASKLLGDSFFVLYGDSYLPIDFAKVETAFLGHIKPALMTVLRNGDQWDRSNVELRDGVLIEYNKDHPNSRMSHIDYGLSIVSSSVLVAHCEAGAAFDLAQLFHDLSVRGELAGLEVHERFYEIGSFSGLQETINLFQARQALSP